MYTNAYIIPVYEEDNTPIFTNSDIKSAIIALIKLIIAYIDSKVPIEYYSSESLVKIRKIAANGVKLSLMMSSELENDPDITKILDDYIEEAEKKKKCYIATAIMKNPNHPYVILLRKYRDDVLTNSFIGRKLIDFYYLYSPTIAQAISQHNFLRKMSLYLIIRPFTFVARFSIKRNYSKHIARTGRS